MFRFSGSRNGKHAVLAANDGASPGQDFIIRAEGVVKSYQTGTEQVHALRGVDRNGLSQLV